MLASVEESESDIEYNDFALLYPFTSKEIIPEVKKSNHKELKMDTFFEPDFYFFNAIGEFICKPNFKKACLLGRLQAQMGVFGIKIKTQKFGNGALRVWLILKKFTAAKIHKFFLGFDSLSGQSFKEKLLVNVKFKKKKDICVLEEEYQTPIKEEDKIGIFKYKFVLSLKNTLPFIVPSLELSYKYINFLFLKNSTFLFMN